MKNEPARPHQLAYEQPAPKDLEQQARVESLLAWFGAIATVAGFFVLYGALSIYKHAESGPSAGEGGVGCAIVAGMIFLAILITPAALRWRKGLPGCATGLMVGLGLSLLFALYCYITWK